MMKETRRKGELSDWERKVYWQNLRFSQRKLNFPGQSRFNHKEWIDEIFLLITIPSKCGAEAKLEYMEQMFDVTCLKKTIDKWVLVLVLCKSVCMLYVCLLWGRIEIITFVYLNSVWMKAAARKLRRRRNYELISRIWNISPNLSIKQSLCVMLLSILKLLTVDCFYNAFSNTALESIF